MCNCINRKPKDHRIGSALRMMVMSPLLVEESTWRSPPYFIPGMASKSCRV